MLEAGKSGGFSANNANYITALQHIDAYIGEFLQAIDERKNAFYEDWLVVVTSNHGGKEDGSYGETPRGTKYVWDILLSALYGTEDARKKNVWSLF
ncbi:hypothetical protein BFINE_43840 [Bacteroides finegoldii DSM 17565]|nr:hypothetical protein BFINE_43840 [Bacteroides finegoldii DSM 17565]